MDILAEELAPVSRKQDAVAFLEDVLQSRTSYDSYFTSLPEDGSVVQDIAEVDAQLVQLEKQMKEILTKGEEPIFKVLLADPLEGQLSLIKQEIDQLWEFSKEKPDHGLQQEQGGQQQHTDTEWLDEPEESKEDAFHVALSKLKQNTSTKDDNLGNVLENLSSISDLLELPMIVSTCVKTGHYQEALMCYSHARTLPLKFPGVSLVQSIVNEIRKEITTTMLEGLVKLLRSNLTVNAIKKTVTYLSSVPPFSDNPQALQQVFLTMRYKFIEAEIASYTIDDTTTDTVKEMMLKRKIEVVREHVYGTVSVFTSTFTSQTADVDIPLFEEKSRPVPTSIALLQFVNECSDMLVQELVRYKHHATESVCLQLVYCSFRLSDNNVNFHHLFINKLWENSVFSKAQLQSAMEKRKELASKYY